MTVLCPARAESQAERQQDQEPEVGLRLLVLLAFIAAASPLAIDLYLASFPGIQRDLATTPTMVQLTLTAYLVGISVGQPIWGPLSERYGRRRPLIVSNAITVASSVLVALAPTIEVLIGARLLQALSAASGMVIARAMISDRAHGYAGVRALALMMTILGVVPVAAPTLGGLMATFLPWRGVLGVFAVVVGAQLVVSARWVPETLPPVRRTTQLRYGDLGRMLARPAYLSYGLTLGLSVAVMMAYLSGSSFIYQEVLGFSPVGYGLVFAANAVAMILAGLLSSRLARRKLHPARTAGMALPGVVLCCVAMALVSETPWPALIVVPSVANAFCVNLVTGNCMGLAMAQARDLPGAGSAVLGLFMFGFGALVTPLASAFGGVGSAVPTSVVMALTALSAASVFALGRWWVGRHPLAEAAFA
jgi:DHA1 family bicyclomycin/chloramphenicol resistance-like MFS transporter